MSPQEAWEMLKSKKDVICWIVGLSQRFVGIPDLSEITKKPFIEWQTFPVMQKNENFLQEIVNSGVEKDTKLIIICRSGARSTFAEFLTTQGYITVTTYQGFEGGHDSRSHRGNEWVEIFWITKCC